MKGRVAWFAVPMIVVSVQLSGCASPKSRASEQVTFGQADGQAAGAVTQAELQQDLQRFTSVFLDRVAQAMGDLLKSKSEAVREEGLRRALLYATNSLDIATGASPELSLMDMIVFVELNRAVLEEHWIPEVFKAEGKELAFAFDRAVTEIWAIADKVSTPRQQELIRGLISDWQAANRGQIRVEGVRFGEFAQIAGRLEEKRAKEPKGLLSGISSGIEKADQALLMADRVMFLAQRMPFLARMHAALGTGEIMDWIAAKLDSAEIGSMMTGSQTLVMSAGQAAREGRLLAESLYPLILPRQGQLRGDLVAANDLASKSLRILEQLNSATPAAVDRLEGLMLRLLLSLFALGTGLVLVWWGGYWLVKRRLLAVASGLRATEERDAKKAA